MKSEQYIREGYEGGKEEINKQLAAIAKAIKEEDYTEAIVVLRDLTSALHLVILVEELLQ